MSTGASPYRAEQIQGRLAIALLPELNEVAWSDIERVGNELIEKINQLPSPKVLVDLTPLNYMGSAQVALVVRVYKAVKEKSGKLVVANSDKMVAEVLSLAGLNKVWNIVDSREEGLNELGLSGAAARSQGDDDASESAGMGWGLALASLAGTVVAGAIVWLATGGKVGWTVAAGATALALILGLAGTAFCTSGPKIVALLATVVSLGLLFVSAMNLGKGQTNVSTPPASETTPAAPTQEGATAAPANTTAPPESN